MGYDYRVYLIGGIVYQVFLSLEDVVNLNIFVSIFSWLVVGLLGFLFENVKRKEVLG